MLTVATTWRDRSIRLARIILWVALLIGVGFDLTFALLNHPDEMVATYGAAGAAMVYVIGVTVVPGQMLRRTLVRELAALLGVGLVMVAVGLSAGFASPYLLLSVGPSLLAAATAGLRLGISTAFLSGLSLAAVGLLTGAMSVQQPLVISDWVPLALWSGLYLMVAAAFSYARRLLIDQERQTEAFATASEEAVRRMQRLDDTNRLLTELASVTDASSLSPISMAASALDNLEASLPVEGVVASLQSGQGPVVVARRVPERAGTVETAIPLDLGGPTLGEVVIATNEELSEEQRELAVEVLRPLALGFSNVLLLQEITQTAIKEERVRLARELHDEIGPSLASLGLALDVALVQGVEDPTLAGNLERLRSDVGMLVEEVRATVADLRSTASESLSQVVLKAAARAANETEVVVDLRENRPPRPAISSDVAAIVTEAIRNALTHSGAEKIRVEGDVDFERGWVQVSDGGRGFSLTGVPDGHFGLMGMRERARRMEGQLDIESGAEGTSVRLSWGGAA
jgi:signal transduction histidine kinase